jgi:cysteine synthase A
MWEQSEGNIDAYLDFAGTGGTFIGCAKALRKHKPEIRCYLVEPATAAYLSGDYITNPNHRIQGGGYNMELPLVEKQYVTDYIKVSDEEAMETARQLASFEGVFAGFSSGANVAAAIKLLENKEKGNTIALTINDSGLKYLSTDLY